MHRFLVVLVITLFPAICCGQITVTDLDHSPAVNPLRYPNTSQKEEIGDMPWISRGPSHRWFPATLLFKDASTWNCGSGTITYARLWGRNDQGQWMIDEQDSSLSLNTDYKLIVAGINLNDLAYAGYQVGDAIEFKWEYEFDCFTTPRVHREQHFFIIKGEALPLFPGQYTSDLHYHGFFTDDALEYGGPKDHLRNPFGGGFPQIVSVVDAVGMQIVHWTDHGYDMTQGECTQHASDAATYSDGSRIVIPGVEGHVQGSNGYLHVGTNICVRTPINLPIGADNTGSLWSLGFFIQQVESAGGYWYACHPWAGPPVEGLGGIVGTWEAPDIERALTSAAFVGFQGWNRSRTSTKEDIDLEASVVNPYPWVRDPDAFDDLELAVSRVDSIQQAHLFPLRRVSLLAGSDAHGDGCYSTRPGVVGPDVDNNAVGRVFTVSELPSFTENAHRAVLLNGRSYVSNGPGLEFGVDTNGDGVLETTFGQINDASEGGNIVVHAKSNGEFGNLTQITLFIFTATSVDSMVRTLSGMDDAETFPVNTHIFAEPTAVRAYVQTTGGYGDLCTVPYRTVRGGLTPCHGSRAYTGWIYFNTIEAVSAPVVANNPAAFTVSPNPTLGIVELTWSRSNRPNDIIVYDVAGRRIATVRPTGYGAATWKAQNARPGTYFVRAEFPNVVETKKVTLVR